MPFRPACGEVVLELGKGNSRIPLRLPPQARVLVPFWSADLGPSGSLELGFDLVCPGRGRERFTALIWGRAPARLSFSKPETRLCTWNVDTLSLNFRPKAAWMTLRLEGGVRLRGLGYAWRAHPPAKPRPVSISPSLISHLRVPAYSQRRAPGEIAARICSPTSLSMALAGLGGRSLDYAAWAEEVLDRGADLYGNWSFNTAAASEWLSARNRPWLCRPAFLESLGQAKGLLAGGLPLILSLRFKSGRLTGSPLRQTSGHLVLLRGFDGKGGALVHDPAAASPQGVARVYKIRELERAWAGSGRLAYVFRKSGSPGSGGPRGS